MGKIVGNPTITPMAVPDWRQTNELKADFIRNKPTKLSEFENDIDGIPSIVYTEIDNFTDGVCKIVPQYTGEWLEFDPEEGFTIYSAYSVDSDFYALCMAHKTYGEGEYSYYQMLIFPDGNIYQRNKYDWEEYNEETGDHDFYVGEWSKWRGLSVDYASLAGTASRATTATNANYATKADKDGNGNIITDTYATKEEFADKFTWKLLGEATVTEANVTDAGEDGVKSIAIDCGDLSGYDELRINLQCGVNKANEEITNANLRSFDVGILNDIGESIGQDDRMLIFNQGNTNAVLNHTYINNIIINSYFSGGILQYSEIFNNNYSSHCYRTAPSISVPSLSYKLIGTAGHAKIGHPIDLKSGKHIVLFESVRFKFPAGTTLTVYGR